MLSGSIGAAQFTIDVPKPWNGTLFLYSHGYAAPGSTNPSSAFPDPVTGQWLLAGGYALAASTYSSTGWAIEDALRDQVALLDYFAKHVGKPKLDAAYAFKTLLAPHSQLEVVNITDPAANSAMAADLMSKASATPAGRARIALMAALADLPGWFLPTEPEPAASDYAARVSAQTLWESRVDFPFAFNYRAELERRAGGNPSWNVGVDYRHQLAISPDRDEVVALYRAASIDLDADLSALNAGATIKPDSRAVAYLDRYISFDGEITVPVLTAHTTADGLVVPQDETAYADVVRSAGKQDLLRQAFVHRAGHCAFTSAEVISLIKVMLRRLNSGLGSHDNAIGGFFAAPPSFVDYAPGPYPRPFPKGSTPPA